MNASDAPPLPDPRPKSTGGRSLVFADGTWHEGNPGLLGPRTHGVWLSSVVFDGARYFDGAAPDLNRHCQRAVDSARILGLEPMLTGFEIAELAWEGIAHFPPSTELYICPMFYADSGFIVPDPASTRFALTLWESPLPEPKGFSAHLSRFRRPARDTAPTDAKASCLYPNVSRAVKAANQAGFDTAVMLDPIGNVAEFAYTNLFYARDHVVYTPMANGTFLNGLTRQRVIKLLRDAGVDVVEKAVAYHELFEADEIFATGNYQKVGPLTRLEDKSFKPGPMYQKARDLYWEFARNCRFVDAAA
ncbi:branched-chain amino acid aminotransferase [Roseospirillum parvum]|uniref:Probable branched-chain-amino-acid aminotransferase n=1 Tax=Roseospirillum parvum TaxID=83401 RepID=A0A1G7W8D2_9PROT|nr:branched-chain amino acid aminotransferase [Roseospirillum parvum]SDG68079.1 branched-chain amino acid aminotransferase [Roseospirillum parvum]